jgi:hypothetical protein
VLKCDKQKTVGLARGNGHRYVMLVYSQEGATDLEKMASPQPQASKDFARYIPASAILWTVLLASVTGLQDDRWYMLIISAIGMMQNLAAAGVPMKTDECNVRIANCATESIASFQPTDEGKVMLKERRWTDDTIMESLRQTDPMGVMGPLVKLELRFSPASAALLRMVFPGPIDYDHEEHVRLRDWEKAY